MKPYISKEFDTPRGLVGRCHILPGKLPDKLNSRCTLGPRVPVLAESEDSLLLGANPVHPRDRRRVLSDSLDLKLPGKVDLIEVDLRRATTAPQIR